LYADGELQSALECYAKTLRIRPLELHDLLVKMRAEQGLGLRDQALDTLNQVLAHQRALEELGHSGELQNYADALCVVREILPDAPNAAWLIAHACYELIGRGLKAEYELRGIVAARCYKSVLRLDPANRHAKAGLERLCRDVLIDLEP
jgi:tetratricopeptide (TPR) repeat protein